MTFEFTSFSNSISVISGRCLDNERLCTIFITQFNSVHIDQPVRKYAVDCVWI